jgi:NADH:ubiquinone oxidoreductase subunit 6 (subunit J)
VEITEEQSSNLADYVIQTINSNGQDIVQQYVSYKTLDEVVAVIFFTVCIMILGITTKRVNKFIENLNETDKGSVYTLYNIIKYTLYFVFSAIVLCSIINIIGYNHYTDGMIVNDILKSIKRH